MIYTQFVLYPEPHNILLEFMVKAKICIKKRGNFWQLQFKIIALYPIRAGCTRIFNKKVNVLNEQGL